MWALSVVENKTQNYSSTCKIEEDEGLDQNQTVYKTLLYGSKLNLAYEQALVYIMQ